MGLYETLKAAKLGAASDVFTTLRAQQAPFAKKSENASLIPFPYDLPTSETAGVNFSYDESRRIIATGKTTGNCVAYISRNVGQLSAGEYTLSVNGKHEGLIIYLRDATAAATITSIQSGSSSTSNTFTLQQDSSTNITLYMTRGSGYDVDMDFTIQLIRNKE